MTWESSFTLLAYFSPCNIPSGVLYWIMGKYLLEFYPELLLVHGWTLLWIVYPQPPWVTVMPIHEYEPPPAVSLWKSTRFSITVLFLRSRQPRLPHVNWQVCCRGAPKRKFNIFRGAEWTGVSGKLLNHAAVLVVAPLQRHLQQLAPLNCSMVVPNPVGPSSRSSFSAIMSLIALRANFITVIT